MKKKSILFSSLICIAMLIAAFVMQLTSNISAVQAEIAGKEFYNYVLTGIQGRYPYHYFDSLTNASYTTSEFKYYNQKGELVSNFRAINADVDNIFTSQFSKGEASISLSGEMLTLANSGHYYAYASAGFLAFKDSDKSKLILNLINGDEIQTITSSKVHTGGTYSPEWLQTNKIFLKGSSDVLKIQFSNLEKSNYWDPASFMLFEPTINFGIEIDKIDNVTVGGTVTKNSLVKLEATNFLSSMSGESLIKYYKKLHAIEWEIVSGGENGTILGNYLSVSGQSGSITVRPKCLKDSTGSEYVYGDTITFNIDGTKVQVNAFSNFDEGVVIRGAGALVSPNRNVSLFLDSIKDGYSLLRVEDETGAQLPTTVTSSGKIRIVVSVGTTSKNIRVILQKTISVEQILIKEKIYDKTDAAEIEEIVFSGGDLEHGVGVDMQRISATFSNSLPGEDITVKISGSVVLTGENAYMYNLVGRLPSAKGNILKRNIVVKANDITIEYGENVPALTYTIEGDMLQGDNLIGALSTNSNGEIGEYDILIGTLNNPNYNIEFIGSKLVITKRHINLTNIYVDNKTYDGTTSLNNNLLHYTQSGSFLTKHNAKLNYSGIYSSKNAGNVILKLNFTISGTDAKYYELNISETTINTEILPKEITVEAYAANKEYGAKDPELKYFYDKSDLVNGDVITGSVLRTQGESVGEYTITQGTLAAANYKINFISAKFTIFAREITIKADEKNKTYGDNDPQLTYKITYGDVLAGDELGVVLARTSGEKIGNYAISIQSQTNQNYKISFVSANLTINKRQMNVSITPINKNYDGNINCELDIYLTNNILSDAISFNGYAKFESKNVGVWNISYFTSSDALINDFSSSVLSGNNLDCYEITFNFQSTARIDKREITINLDERYQSKQYGYSDAGFPFTVDNLVEGETLVGILTREAGENVGEYEILLNDLTEENNTNYKITYNFERVFKIVKRDVVIVVDNKAIEFGDEEGEIVFYLSDKSPLPIGILLEDLIVGNPTRERGNGIGDYQYLVGSLAINEENNKNYNLVFEGGILTIYSKTIIIQIENVEKVYGSSDPIFTYSIIGDKNFDLTLDFVREIGENVGEYRITGLLNDVNFNAVINPGTLKITPAKLTIRANSIVKTYGEQDPILSYYLKNGILKFNDTLSSILTGELGREAGENVGVYSINIGSLECNGNYEITFECADFEIKAKDLFVTANPVVKYFDESSDPELTYIVSGLIRGDQLTGTLVREEGNQPGEYQIFVGSLSAENYNIIFTSAKFSIEKRKITVKIDYVSKIFDGTDNCELTYTLSGNLLEGSEPEITLFKESGHNVGRYLINAEVNSDIYDVTIVTNYFEILKRDVTVKANNFIINYGEEIPELTYTVEGDIENSELIVNLYRTQSTAAGEYTIYSSILNSDNYNITYKEGKLLIKKLKLVIKVDNLTKTYGSADPIFDYSIVEGQLIGHDVLSGAIIRENGENVGVYKFICALENSNYEIELLNSSLTITRKEIFLVTSVMNKVYDGTDIAYLRTPTLSGVLASDDVYFEYERESVARFVQIGVGDNIPVVVYGGTLAGKDSGNYYITYPTDLVADITHAVVEAEDQEVAQDVFVEASGNNTTLKKGTELFASKYETENLEILKFGDSKSVVGAYNLSLKNNGNTFETGKMTVNIKPYSNGLNNVQVYRLNSDGTKTLLNTKYEDGIIKFETDEMGVFIVVADNDNWLNIILIVSGSILLVVIVAIIISKNRKKKKSSKNA